MAKRRSLVFVPAAEKEYQTAMTNLLVAGGSYVWNNSEEHACTWPYYIKDMMGFDQVYDCSQSGGGPDNVFNSIVNELTIDPNLTKDNTFIAVMWPELHWTDVIAETEIIKDYHDMSLYHFNNRFSNLSIFNEVDPKEGLIDRMCYEYKKIVSPDAQEYQSLIKIIALSDFLNHRGFKHIFLAWKNFDKELLLYHGIPDRLIDKSIGLVEELISLDEFAENTNQRISKNDPHPTSNAHIQWARKYLAPYLCFKFPDVFHRLNGAESLPRGT